MSDYKEIWESEYIQTKIKEVWNAAIEAAANKVESNGAIGIAMEVRKLKK